MVHPLYLNKMLKRNSLEWLWLTLQLTIIINSGPLVLSNVSQFGSKTCGHQNVTSFLFCWPLWTIRHNYASI